MSETETSMSISDIEPTTSTVIIVTHPSTSPAFFTYWDKNGVWSGGYTHCPKACKARIDYHIEKRLWNYGHFPGVRFSPQNPLRNAVAKVYMEWYYISRRVHKVDWNGTIEQLVNMTKRDQQTVIPENIRTKWNAATDREALVTESDLPKDFHTISREFMDRSNTTLLPMIIRTIKAPNTLVAFRIPIPQHLIDVLKQSDSLLPIHKATGNQRGNHRIRHYALWSVYSKHPYMSSEFLQDGNAAHEWLAANIPLFQYFGIIF